MKGAFHSPCYLAIKQAQFARISKFLNTSKDLILDVLHLRFLRKLLFKQKAQGISTLGFKFT